MSEVKRATLITFGTQKANPKESRECSKTVRISLILPESNEDTYPEYNYKEELAAAKKRSNVKNSKSIPNGFGLDPLDDDSDVQRIAREMEAKYGTGVSTKKKRKGRRDDYADIGMGYDESDSFIDNTDGYDEMIPQNVTTLHGGFYINCGALEFKTDDEVSSEVSSSSSEDEANGVRETSRKRILETSDESEGEKETDKSKNSETTKKKIKLENGTNNPKLLKKKLFSHDKMKRMKKKHEFDSQKKKSTVKELLREKRQDLDLTVVSELEKSVVDNEKESVTTKENKKPPQLSSVTDIIESVVKASGNEKIDKSEAAESVNKENIINKESVSNKQAVTLSSEGESSRDGKPEEIEIVKLPENLPNDILDLINSIKDMASKSTEGKVKFFSGPVSDMLLSLEKKCRCLGKQSRLRVYEHLAPFVKCRKETLIRRAKNLVLESDRMKSREMLSRLKAAIEITMPTALEAYERESQMMLQKRLSSDANGEDAKNGPKIPRKRFPWTEDMKKLLRELVQLRKKCFLLEGKQKDSIESLLEQYLKTEVLLLWPEGWMYLSSLKKISGCVENKKNQNSIVKHATDKNSSNKKPSVNDIVQNFHLNPVKEIQQNLNNNSGLSITPVPATSVATSKNNSMFVNSVKSIKSDINISKVNASDNNVSKTLKTLPGVEITKTSPSNVHQSSSSSNFVKHQEKQERDFTPPLNCDTKESSKEVKHKVHPTTSEASAKQMKSAAEDLIMLLEEPVQHQPQNLKVTKPSEKTCQKDRNEQKHCQIIDLTEHSEYKRKLSTKHKSKEDVEKVHEKSYKSRKEEITGSSALSQIIADSLSDGNIFSSTPNTNATKMKEVKHPSSIYPNMPNAEYQSKQRSTNEGDDIQKVMEGLKVLHRMSSSPIKSNENTSTSSPVSVIAYNKNYAPKTTFSQSSPSNSSVFHKGDYSKPEFCTGFQDAFQKQLYEIALLKTTMGQTTPTTSKANYNSVDKYPHISSGGSTSVYPNEKYMQGANNNYAQANSTKIKNHIPSTQSGSYNLLDDMYTNFLSEYGGYPKTAPHKPKPPPQK